MRRASTRLVLLGLALATLGLPSAAGAAPAVTIKVKIVPIPVNPSAAKGPTYPGTGSILGAGAAIETEIGITGTEYGGFPPPLIGVKFITPAGTKLHTAGFATCPNAILESHEVQKCPKKSSAGPVGSAGGVVSFGSTRVHESLTVQPFFAEGGGLAFFSEGRTPASIEILSKGAFKTGPGGFGPEFNAEIPLVETVPGAPYGVVETIKVKVGAAFKQGKKLISYGTVPKKCPKGGFPVKAELSFYGGAMVPVEVKVPCPKK
jgi:hypothetical protein